MGRIFLGFDLEVREKQQRLLGWAVSSSLGFIFYFIWLHHVACGILVPSPGIDPRSLAVKAQSPNPLDHREFPSLGFRKLLAEGHSLTWKSGNQ